MRTSPDRASILRALLRGSLAAVIVAVASPTLTACGAGSTAAVDASGYHVRSPARDGWVRLSKRDGELRFMMPGVPDVRHGREGDDAVTVFELRAEANSRRFLVHVFDRGGAPVDPPGARGLDALERRIRTRFRGEYRRLGEGVRDGHLVRDMEIDRVSFHGHVAHMRLIDGGRYGVAMTLIHLPGTGSSDADLRHFRESLQIEARRASPSYDPDLD